LLQEASYKLQSEQLMNYILDLTEGQPYCIRELLDATTRYTAKNTVMTHEDIKHGIQDSFFGEFGRLRMHFEEYFQDCVDTYKEGRDVMISLASGNRTAQEIADDLQIPINEVNHHLERLERFYFIKNVNIDKYKYYDKVFEFWVCGAKSRYKSIAGPYLVGAEAERKLALFLLEHGIDLIYQSYASRGAFDLLMEFSQSSIAVQVKKVERFYYFFDKSIYNRMVNYVEKYGRRLGVICLYNGEEFRFFKLSDLNQTRRGYSITQKTPYATNPLALI
jgi:Holliday junction resolvase